MANRILRALRRAGMSAYVGAYRRTRGLVGGRGGDGTPVLLLTVAGRRTGIEHTVPLGFFEHGDAYLVVGAGGGSKVEPQWSRNLAAAETARIQVGSDVLDVTVARLGPGERDAAWSEIVVARSPAYGRLPQRAGRTIPVFRLRPVGSDGRS